MTDSVQQLYESSRELSEEEFDEFVELLAEETVEEDAAYRILPWPPQDPGRPWPPDMPWLPNPPWGPNPLPIPPPYPGPTYPPFPPDDEPILRPMTASGSAMTARGLDRPVVSVSARTRADLQEEGSDEIPVDIDFTVNTDDDESIRMAGVVSEIAGTLAKEAIKGLVGSSGGGGGGGGDIHIHVNNCGGTVNIYQQ